MGKTYPLKGNYFIKPFKTVHVVDSQGYILYHQKKRLKPEWQGCSQQEIKEASRSGVTVSAATEVCAEPDSLVCAAVVVHEIALKVSVSGALATITLSTC